MLDPDRGREQLTVPGALLKRPAIAALAVLAGAGLGVIGAGLGGKAYTATAKVVVEDPRASLPTSTAVVAPDRYVAEQLAVFELETLAEAAASELNRQLAEEARQRSDAEVVVGTPPVTVRIGLNGSATVGEVPSRVVLAAGGLRVGSAGAPRLDERGAMVTATGAAVVSAAGLPVTAGPSDVVIARDDGLFAIVPALGPLVVVAPSGAVVDLATAAAANEPAPVFGAADVSLGPNGGIEIGFGNRRLLLDPTERPVIVDVTGEPVRLTSRVAMVGVDQSRLLLHHSGAAVAWSATERIVLPAGEPWGAGEAGGAGGAGETGGLVVLDPDGAVVERSGDVSIRPAAHSAEPVAAFTGRDVLATLAVSARPNSNLISVQFSAATPEAAVAGANAAVEAYRGLREADAADSNAAAVTRADDALVKLTAEFVEAERALTTARLADPNRAAIATQYDQILRELSLAGKRLLETPAESAAAAQRTRDLLTQLDAIERVERVETSRPDLAELVKRRDDIRTRLENLQRERDALVVDARRSAQNVTLFSPATRAAETAGQGPVRLGFVGGVVGLALAAAGAYLLEARRPTVATSEGMARILGTPLLAEVPDFRHERISSQLPVIDEPASYSAEAIRMAAAAVIVQGGRETPLVVGVVSGGVGEGKTTIATNLALALAQTRRAVLAIDTDLEGQVMTLLLHRRTDGVPQWRGLADVLEGIELADALQPIPVAAEGRLDLLAGGSGAATLRHNLDGEELAGLIGEVRDDYDVVVVDVPPLLNVAYAAHVLSALDHVVVVASAGCSARELADVRDRLAFLGVSTSGFLHNRGPLRPERTASVAALHYDLGGRTTARRRHSALRQRQLVPQVGRLAGLIRRRKRALNPSRAERPVAQGAKTDARGPVRQQDRRQTRV